MCTVRAASVALVTCCDLSVTMSRSSRAYFKTETFCSRNNNYTPPSIDIAETSTDTLSLHAGLHASPASRCRTGASAILLIDSIVSRTKLSLLLYLRVSIIWCQISYCLSLVLVRPLTYSLLIIIINRSLRITNICDKLPVSFRQPGHIYFIIFASLCATINIHHSSTLSGTTEIAGVD